MNSRNVSWGRLIAQNPDKQDINFFTKEYESPHKWKIYQNPDDGALPKIINCSDSVIIIDAWTLQRDQEHLLYGGEIVSFQDQEDGGFSDYVFVLMKTEPRNELKRDRSEKSSVTFSHPKSIKVDNDEEINQSFYNFLHSLEGEKDQTGIYQGAYLKGKKHGKGKLIFPNGDIYEGNWVNDVIQAQVKIHFANGKKYEGEIDPQNLMKHGKGSLTLKDDVIIQGNWIQDEIEPQVTILYYGDGQFDKARYSGPIDPKTMLRNGEGLLAYKNGDSYEGNFVDEFYNGHGIYKWKDGDCYKGEFRNGERNGWGVMKYANGSKLECNWRKGKSEGKGTISFKNGDVLEGKWLKDDLQTPAMISYKNGDQYKGTVCQENFKREGKGVLNYKNGDMYVGYWKDDKKNGKGIFKYGHGLEISGSWRNGVNVGKGTLKLDGLFFEGKWKKQR